MKMNIFNVTKQTELPVNIVKVCRYCLDICRYCVDIVNVFPHIREVHDLPPSEHIFYVLPIIKSCVDDNTYFNLHKKMCFYIHINARTQIDLSIKISKAMNIQN